MDTTTDSLGSAMDRTDRSGRKPPRQPAVERTLARFDRFQAWVDRHGWIVRIVVGVVGIALVIAGILMLVLPGPGVVTILLGLVALTSVIRPLRAPIRRLVERSAKAIDDVVDRRADRGA